MSSSREKGIIPPDSINEFAMVGEFGSYRVPGPFSVEKEGTIWSIAIPLGEADYGKPNPTTLSTIRDSAGTAIVLIADGKAAGGGIVDEVFEPEGEDELHVLVDQYAMGDR